jgi:hypothetical protein
LAVGACPPRRKNVNSVSGSTSTFQARAQVVISFESPDICRVDEMLTVAGLAWHDDLGIRNKWGACARP